jgi:hypothetical protein
VVGSGEQRRGEVGPSVREMASELGDPIWSPVKEEAHKRGFTVGMRACGWGGPPVIGWRSGGGRRLRGHGAAVSSGGGHCGEGSLRGRSERPIRVAALGG